MVPYSALWALYHGAPSKPGYATLAVYTHYFSIFDLQVISSNTFYWELGHALILEALLKMLPHLGLIKMYFPGWFPLASTSAKTKPMANSPQSAEAFCIWTSMSCTVMASLGVAWMAAIWFIIEDVMAGSEPSKMFTSLSLQPIVDMVIQWPQPLRIIWTYSPVWTVNAKVSPKATFSNPLTYGNCFAMRCWLALIRSSVSQWPQMRVAWSLSDSLPVHCFLSTFYDLHV